MIFAAVNFWNSNRPLERRRHGTADRRALQPRRDRGAARPARGRPRGAAQAAPHGARRLHSGVIHGLHRQLRAHRGAAQAAGCGRRRLGRRAMGDQRLHPGAGLAHADRRRARRHLRQGARIGDRLPAVRRGFGGLRTGAVGRMADRRARRARRRGGAGDAIEPGIDRRDLPEGRTQRGHRRVGGGLRAHHRRRAGAGRLAH